MQRFLKGITVAVAGLAMLLTTAACEDNDSDNDFDRQQAAAPARAMEYPMTRNTINFWVDTWDEPGKLSYVYLLASNGQLIGYYIFEGLPVSYCASIEKPYELVRPWSGYGGHVVPAPAMDGVYYSGNQCDAYYGKDAVSGSYWEYTVGNGITHLVSSEPMPRQDVEPLGVATIEDVG